MYEKACRPKKNITNVSDTSKSSSESMFLSCHEAQERNKYLWLLDSGCSNHIT